MKIEDTQIRVDEKTPAGGDYSIGYYFNWVNGKMVPAIPGEAKCMEICEFTNDGKMIQSTLCGIPGAGSSKEP